jgi:DNA polymerase-1
VTRQLKRLRDPSANPQVREQMVEIADMLEHRAKFIKCTKLLSAFGETLVEMADADGRLHGEFVLAKAATGRTSCKSPNLQQLPNANDFRNLFTAPPGRVLVVGDYTQIEVRVAGLLAGEPKIAEFFRSGYDVHKASAALMYGVPYEKVSKSQRKAAKAITFGILYGMGADALAEQLGCDKGGAEEQLRIWEQAFPVLSAWREQEAKDAKERGYVLMADGRRVRCTGNSRPAQLYNYPVQGSAASCQYAALAWLWEAFQVFGVDATVVAVVHDEMVVECAEGEVEQATELLHEAMAHGMRAVFGADVELAHLCGIAAGADWSEKE